MSSLSDFLEFIWEDTAGWVGIATLSKEGIWERKFAQWPLRREQIEAFMEMQVGQGSEVYNTPAMFKAKPPPGHKFSKEMFLGSHVLWCEFDGNAPDNWENPDNSIEHKLILPPEKGGVIGPPADSGPPTGQPGAAATPSRGSDPGVSRPPGGLGPGSFLVPSFRIRTSSENNQHVYWKLQQFITDVDTFENLNRTLAYELGADDCWDSTRVLRPPDTTNFGISKPERKGQTYPVVIEESSNRVYPVQSFRQTKDFRPLVQGSIGKIPDIREVLAKHQWDDEFYAAFTAEPQFKKRSDQIQQLAYFGAEAGFSNEEIYAIMIDADLRWEKYKGRNDRDRRFADHLERARNKHPTADVDLTFENLVKPKSKESIQGIAQEVPQISYLINEILEAEINIEWMIEGLLPKNGYGFIAGPNGIGKTQLAIRLAEAVVEGKRFLNYWPTVRGNNTVVSFLSLEMNFVELKQFYKDMKGYGSFFETGLDRFHTIPVGNELAIDTEQGRKAVEAIVNADRTDLLIIDSLSMAMSGNFKDDSVVIKFNKTIKKLIKELDIAIVVVHHNRKGQDKKYRYNSLDDLFGSRFLAQDTAFVLMLDQPDTLKADEEIAVNPAKIRFGKQVQELIVKHDKMNFTGAFTNDSGPMALEGNGGFDL